MILIFAILSFFSFCRGGAPPLSGGRGGRAPGRPPPSFASDVEVYVEVQIKELSRSRFRLRYRSCLDSGSRSDIGLVQVQVQVRI